VAQLKCETEQNRNNEICVKRKEKKKTFQLFVPLNIYNFQSAKKREVERESQGDLERNWCAQM